MKVDNECNTDRVQLVSSTTYCKNDQIITYYEIRINDERIASGQNYVYIKCIFEWILKQTNVFNNEEF